MRILLALVLACFVALIATPAFAQLDPCVNDPLACVEETAEEVVEEVEEASEEVSDTVEETVDEVEEVVAPPASGGGGGTGPPDGDSGGSTSGRRETGADRQGTDAASGAGGAPEAAAGRTRGGARQREPSTAPTPLRVPEEQSVLERISEALADPSAALTFPIALLVVVASFMLVQSRIDRGEPKLSLAPVDADDDELVFG